MPEIRSFDYTPILGWSATRFDTFSICKRKYFLTYYAKYDPDVAKMTIDRYKALVTVPMEAGSIVHEIIEQLLNRLKVSTAEIDRARFFAAAAEAVERHLRTERFAEVLYGERPAIEAADLDAIVVPSLENLLDSARLASLMALAVEGAGEWIVDPPGFGETRLGELKIYCKVDFLFPVGDAYHIIDWKTGKPDAERHRKQLIGYASWAAYHFEVPPSRVTPSIAYLLPAYSETEETFDDDDLETFSVQVRAETQEMYEHCRDVEANIPRDKSDFPMVEDDRICTHCNFRGICYPERFTARGM